jgi:hypothetical protein
VTVSRRFLEKLEAAKAALSHALPGAGADEILEAGLDLLLERVAKRRGLVEKPRPPREAKGSAPGKPASPYVPAHVRREVWKRDGGRCQFPLDGGRVCGSTHCLEIDHIKPRALGGESTIENCRIACRAHNGLAARRVFGDAWMDRYSRRERRSPEARSRPPAAGGHLRRGES